MSYTLIDKTGEKKNLIRQRASVFLRLMSDEILANSTPVTPKKSGRLRMDVVKSVLGLSGKIVWGKRYASRQETKQHANYTTPGTGPHYAQTGIKKGIAKTQVIAKAAGLI